jgi:hypothetical protein
LPYFSDINKASGSAEVCREDITNCYDTDPRSQLFKKYQGDVVDVASTMWIIRHNDWLTDAELTMGSACNVSIFFFFFDIFILFMLIFV